MIQSVLGGEDNIGIVLGTYEPSLRCRGTILAWESCPAVVYGMEASTKSEVFGLASDPRSEVVLPAKVDAGEFIPASDSSYF